EHAGVGLDLTEVWIDRRVELEIRGHDILEIAADRHVLCASDPRAVELGHVLGHEVRRGFEPAWCLEPLQTVDLAELRHEPRLRLADDGPAHALGVAVEVATARQAAGAAALPPIRQLRQWAAALGLPARGIDARRDVQPR